MKIVDFVYSNSALFIFINLIRFAGSPQVIWDVLPKKKLEW